MKIADLATRRLHTQRLAGPRFEAPEEAVSWLGAVQSQDYGPAKWSVGQRTAGATDADLDQAFNGGAILRTHVLRPTWHFVHAADIRWLLEVTGPRVQVANSHMYRQVGLDDAELTRCTKLLTKALTGGNHLTRKEIKALLEKAGIATEGFRTAYILMNAELNQVICSGPLDGKQHTYALLDERAPGARGLSRDDALAELLIRYFTGHGPATAKDLKAWSSLTMADIKKGLEMVADRLESHEIDGVTYWSSTDVAGRMPPSPTVHLMQAYDEYVMGYSESRHFLDVSGAVGAQTEPSSFNMLVFLDGQIAGHWKRTIKKASVEIETALYSAFNAAQSKALLTAADAYGKFLGLEAVLV
ncbi:MAG: winged helix DNA-binding domain-containing protein [Actinobacteria bacterium]|jgi:hypothetical protein|nr:winged helix DNA-binding domain-containing protein [Actinomycetota bacterium]